MDISNIAQLKNLNTPALQNRSYTRSQERDVEFLSLRLLNKRGRVRLSTEIIDYSRRPGKSSLLAVGNLKGYLAAAIYKEGGNHILLATLNELRAIMESGKPETEPYIPFTPQRSLLKVPGIPIIVKFALNDERLIVGFMEGPILVYSSNDLFGSTSIQPQPIHTLPGDASAIPRDILPNPGESPELVAIMRGVHGQEPGHQVDIIDVQQLKHVAGWRKGNDPDQTPVSISWSPKGKQIAIGLESGDMLLYTPLAPETPKSQLHRPPSVSSTAHSLLATTWLTNPTFYTIFSSPEASSSLFDASKSSSLENTHVVSIHDSKSQSVVDTELLDPSPPFGAQVSPGPFSIVLRNWSPAKFIIICGDGPSADIGVIGSLLASSDGAPDTWHNFTLEETSTPSLPLGEDAQDMALLGLEVDLTSSKPVRMSEQADDGIPDLPPSPILYAYMSDGTIIAWHILNTTRNPYPGMITAVDSIDVSTAPSPVILQPKGDIQALGMPSPRVSLPASPMSGSPAPPTVVTPPTQPVSPFAKATGFPAPAQGFGAFANAKATPTFGSPGFGFATGSALSTTAKPPEAPAFGASGFGGGDNKQPSALGFGATGFGQSSATPSFGVSGFGSKAAAPAFGQTGFGALSSTTKPTFGSSGGGFAAFAGQGTASFGSPVAAGALSASASKPAQVSPFEQVATPPAPQSAFGTGGSGPASAPPTSVFGAGGSGLATSFGQQQKATQSVSVFGSSISKVPVFGQSGLGGNQASTSQSGAFGGLGALGDSLKPSIEPIPTRFGSPPDSLPGSPGSPNESPTGSPNLRPSTQSIKSTSSYVKPAEGFSSFIKPSGAFGTTSESPKPPTAGAFSQQKSAATFGHSKPAVPAFGTTGFGSSTPSSSSTVTPTFGSTSALGPSKPVFGTSSFGALPQTSLGEPSKPITGGFGAFSTGGGGFAAFANAGKATSFDDILSSDGQKDPKPKETPLVFGNTPAKPSNVPAFGVPAERKEPSVPSVEKPTSIFSTRGLRSNVAEDEDNETSKVPTERKEPSVPSVEKPTSIFSTRDLRSNVVEDEENETSKPRFPEDSIANQEPSSTRYDKDASLSLLSLSEPTPPSEPPSVTKASAKSLENAADDVTSKSVEQQAEASGDRDESASDSFSLTDDGLDDQGVEEVEESPVDKVSPSNTPPRSPEKPIVPTPEPLPQHPLQTEFQRAYQEMMDELVQLNQKAQEMAILRPIISGPRGLDKLVLNNQDFIPAKYSLGDASYFTTMIGTLQKKVASLQEQGKTNQKLLQDLQNLAIISETKQEELSCWQRARADPEFAKTLKARTLGPEHSENQIRLRKALRTAHDRIQKCEDEFESLKKRLEQHKSGRIGMRPPSLDTIDRTCRNIRLALEERMKLIEQLDARIDALSPQASQRLQSGGIHSSSLPTRSTTVTPPFASVAAAALNSERSSLRLKNALLTQRKEPLFTANVVKLDNGETPPLRVQTFVQAHRPEWKLPPVPPLNTPPPSIVNRRSSRAGKRHGAVPLKTGTPNSNAKAVAFDWGPLPGVTPMDTLSPDIRAQNTKG